MCLKMSSSAHDDDGCVSIANDDVTIANDDVTIANDDVGRADDRCADGCGAANGYAHALCPAM